MLSGYGVYGSARSDVRFREPSAMTPATPVAREIIRPRPAPGQPGDFAFLEGRWAISNRRWREDASVWDEFPGEARCWSILGGAGSIEELNIPARDFSGLGLRLLDRTQGVWVDHWVNGKGGVLTLPGMTGGFLDGAGIFEAEELEGASTRLVRGIWDEITSIGCRWRQATSRDAGRTWEENWVMSWVRA